MKRKLQVFVSSTFLDLQSERQAAVQAILKAGHIPAGMELFTAGNQSQLNTIKRWIDESDLYMLILGGRYGSIEPASNLSYTEFEYNYASQQGKNLFSVVITENALEEKVKRHGSKMIETVNSSALALFRAKVLSNISSFFSDEKDVRLCIHESLSDFISDPGLKGWVYGGDVEETKTLRDQLSLVQLENEELRNRITALSEQPAESLVTQPKDFGTLTRELMQIMISIPKEVAKDLGKTEDTLFNLLIRYEAIFVVGIHNEGQLSPILIFLYYNIGSKLITFGLASNEPIAGKSARRISITKDGLNFLAETTRRTASRAS